MFFSLTLMTLLLTDISPLLATSKSRNEQWQQVWERKGEKAFNGNHSLHEADGYEVIDQKHWSDIIVALLLRAQVPNNSCVCDFGCGAGAFLKELQKLRTCSEVYGFDYSESLIHLAKTNHPAGHFWAQNITEPLPATIVSKSFDLTICHGVFMYINSPEDALEVLRNMLSVTKKGGKMLLGDISDESKKDLAIRLRQQTHQNSSFEKETLDHLYVSRELFIDFAKENNLKLEFIEYSEIDPEGYYPNGAYRFCLVMSSSEAFN